MRADCVQKNVFLTTAVVGAFDAMNAMCGHECVLMAMAMDPDWIRDMCDVYATVTIDMLEIAYQQEGLPDGLWVWDDLGFKHRPFMSPAMYRELIFPAHKRLFDFAHSKGLPVVLHCDGLVESLIPHLIEAGINCIQPIEVKAGMDLLRIKKTFGDQIALIGGMDVRELLSNDLARVRKELESKLPQAMAGSGYVLQVDHSVPPQVNYETYKYFVEKGLEIGTYK
jgi:uroporphyrinogen decarboxylase